MFIGDRYGRKINVLRAMTGSSLVLIGTGLVQNIYQLLVLRTLSGLLTGVFSPLVALAVSMAPSTKVGYTTGFLLTAIYTGQILGPIAGGYASELLGFRPPFYRYFRHCNGLHAGLSQYISSFDYRSRRQGHRAIVEALATRSGRSFHL